MMNRQMLLERVSFARRLAPPVLEALAGAAHEQAVARGAIVTVEGEPAEAMYVVAEGRVKIVRHSLDGREQILHIAEQFDHFNTVPMFGGGSCPATSETLAAGRLLVLPRERILQLAHEHPDLALALLGEFANRLRGLVGLVDTLALHTVNGRLARLLLDQARQSAIGQRPPVLTQAEMAAHIGSVREMVGRALKTFEAAGLIRMERGSIQIIDPAGLERQADL